MNMRELIERKLKLKPVIPNEYEGTYSKRDPKLTLSSRMNMRELIERKLKLKPVIPNEYEGLMERKLKLKPVIPNEYQGNYSKENEFPFEQMIENVSFKKYIPHKFSGSLR